MAPTGSSSRRRPTRLLSKQDKLARIYEDDVYPLVGEKLADLLAAGLRLGPRAHVLQIGCGLGSTTAELLSKMDAEGRLIVVEATPALVERARAGVDTEPVGKHVFYRAHAMEGKLPFAENGFDLVLANVMLPDLNAPAAQVAELVRVTKPGGELRLATPLAGTWREFLDVYSDVLIRLRKHETAEALAAYRGVFYEPEALATQLEAAGIAEVAVETVHWDLVFRTGREFFYAPVIEQGPLARWKAIAGKGPEVQDTFLAVKEAIDTYFGGAAFSVSVYAGVFSGTKA
ncbi:MAG: methyltransferase domain-containing protein [Deltaproteobacteria bacterium]|jgi:ubiquinone/menaquinone biosynthesis C-methylase UbiE|nr:methyltransferase domain-containing protein [Deltaproteobacteria bacterium]